MKKIVLILSVAALALASCVKTSDVYTGSPDSRQISFSPLAQPATKADAFNAVVGDFPDNYQMEVSASLNNGAVYFSDVTFSRASSTWTGSQYWPLSPATLNFLAVTNWDVTPASVVSTAFTNAAQQAVVTLGNNAPADLTTPAQSAVQHDLMYAVGRGIVEQSGNGLSYSGNSLGNAAPIDMVFKHALAWVNFTVKTHDSYSGFLLRSIVLNGAYYGGTYTIDNSSNYNYVYDGTTNNSRVATNVTGTWSAPANQASVAVPGWTSGTAVTTSAAPVGSGLMVVPTYGFATPADSFSGFTINYTINGQDLSYTYPSSQTLEQAKKYTYAIEFTLTGIEIAPSVTAWDPQAATNVAVPGV